jgi:hypothetical protein
LHLDLIPGKLKAHVHVHEMETLTGHISCWSYGSDGLWALGQKEMVLTLQRRPGEAPGDYLEEPLTFFAAVYPLAEQGLLVDTGDITEFADDWLLGFRGLAYVPSEPLEGVDLPEQAIAAILLQAEELDTVRDFGLTRVLARLGNAYRYYPYPPWSERSRPGVWYADEGESTILALARRVNVPGTSVLYDGDQIILRVWPRGKEGLQELLKVPEDAVVTLLTEMDPTVNACLVWTPGQTGLEAITTGEADASVITANFIVFVPQQPGDGGQALEDGFVMMLTDASWLAIREALEMEKNLTIPATQEGLGLVVEWMPTPGE